MWFTEDWINIDLIKHLWMAALEDLMSVDFFWWKIIKGADMQTENYG